MNNGRQQIAAIKDVLEAVKSQHAAHGRLIDALERAVGATSSAPIRTPAEVMHISQTDLADELGLSPETIRRIAAGAGCTGTPYPRHTWLAMANHHCNEAGAREESFDAWDAFLGKHGAGKVGDKPQAAPKLSPS